MFDVLFSQEGWLFSIPALLGTLVFLIKIGMMTVAGIGADADIDTDVDAGLEGAHDSTDSFSLLSVQSIAALLMGFGWGGLTARFALEWSIGLSVIAGLAVGGAMVWLLGLMMKAMYDLQASGNIHLSDALGLQGSVYATVPARGAGSGQVRVVINQHSRIFNAVSDGEAIATNTAVRIVRANNDNTLTVSAA
jgi:hypothetical protein